MPKNWGPFLPFCSGPCFIFPYRPIGAPISSCRSRPPLTPDGAAKKNTRNRHIHVAHFWATCLSMGSRRIRHSLLYWYFAALNRSETPSPAHRFIEPGIRFPGDRPAGPISRRALHVFANVAGPNFSRKSPPRFLFFRPPNRPSFFRRALRPQKTAPFFRLAHLRRIPRPNPAPVFFVLALSLFFFDVDPLGQFFFPDRSAFSKPGEKFGIIAFHCAFRNHAGFPRKPLPGRAPTFFLPFAASQQERNALEAISNFAEPSLKFHRCPRARFGRTPT